MKYLLKALRNAVKSLPHQRQMLLKLSTFKEFLFYILSSEFKFREAFDNIDHELKASDDILMNFTLKKLACEVIFYFREEYGCITLDKITDCLQMVVQFAHNSFMIESKDER